MNVKRIYRLYSDEGLQLRHKTPKRRVAAKLREDRSPPAAPNQVCAMGFLSDQLFNGRKIWIFKNCYDKSCCFDCSHPSSYRMCDYIAR